MADELTITGRARGAAGTPGRGGFAEEKAERHSGLEMRTLLISNGRGARRRTSMRLEPMMWSALEEIAAREGQSVHGICSQVDARRALPSLTAAVRVYILSYFRAAATEGGHAAAGHGNLTGRQRGGGRPGKPGDRLHAPA